ncbi:hypothetical protein ABK040_016205 [Willaertia magna]
MFNKSVVFILALLFLSLAVHGLSLDTTKESIKEEKVDLGIPLKLNEVQQQNATIYPISQYSYSSVFLQPNYYRVYYIDIPSSKYVSLSYYCGSSMSNIKLYVKRGSIPTLSSYDYDYLYYASTYTKTSTIYKKSSNYYSTIRLYVVVLNDNSVSNVYSDYAYLTATLYTDYSNDGPDVGTINIIVFSSITPFFIFFAIIIIVVSIIRRRMRMAVTQERYNIITTTTSPISHYPPVMQPGPYYAPNGTGYGAIVGQQQIQPPVQQNVNVSPYQPIVGTLPNAYQQQSVPTVPNSDAVMYQQNVNPNQKI